LLKFLHNPLNVLEEISNKMGLQKLASPFSMNMLFSYGSRIAACLHSHCLVMAVPQALQFRLPADKHTI
jgi:hypothetical protein